MCKSVSLQDNYWFKTADDICSWKDVNLRTNHLSEVVAQVSLHGSSLSLTGDVCTPELNGQGAYAKAWKREADGLWLYKAGAGEGDTESRIEITVSNLLDKCNVDHVVYSGESSDGRYVCKCKCMTTEEKSILPGMDLISYCNANGINPDQKIMELDSDVIYKMWIVDYLVSNRDRHGMNWGFYYNADTLEITGCHPLFDHNNAFDKSLMTNADADYLYDRKLTMRQAAHKAIEKTDFHFTGQITRDDFMNEQQFESFTQRAEELNIKTIERAQSISEQMEKARNDYFALDKENRNGIIWNDTKMRIAVFEDMYLAQCEKEKRSPDVAILRHFWDNCVKMNDYAPRFCSKRELHQQEH